jgi:hypothetical protein
MARSAAGLPLVKPPHPAKIAAAKTAIRRWNDFMVAPFIDWCSGEEFVANPRSPP